MASLRVVRRICIYSLFGWTGVTIGWAFDHKHTAGGLFVLYGCVVLGSSSGVALIAACKRPRRSRRWRRLDRTRRLCRRVVGCRVCHRTGVVMSPECTCGRPSWSYEPCEPWCGTDRCPRGCKTVETHEAALAVWRKHWPPQPEGSWRRP